jgi:CelD/BcsL family acetyltransferase involved in cellulose biosynthesis
MNLTGLKRQRKELAIMRRKFKYNPDSYRQLRDIEEKERKLERLIKQKKIQYAKSRSVVK